MVSLIIWYLMNCVCEKEVYFTCAGHECVKRGRERVLRFLSVRVFVAALGIVYHGHESKACG